MTHANAHMPMRCATHQSQVAVRCGLRLPATRSHQSWWQRHQHTGPPLVLLIRYHVSPPLVSLGFEQWDLHGDTWCSEHQPDMPTAQLPYPRHEAQKYRDRDRPDDNCECTRSAYHREAKVPSPICAWYEVILYRGGPIETRWEAT